MGIEHLRNLALIDDAEPVAFADPHSLSREQAAAVAPAAAGHANTADLLARDDLDAIIVATPNHTHIDVVREVLAHGPARHMLIEKPLCTTMEDGTELVAALTGYPRVAWVGMEYRYMPPVARLIEEVGGGTVGQLRMLSIREHRFPFLPKVGDWNRFSRNTGGTLVEKCCHFFDLMRLIVDREPLRVFASGGQEVNHLDESYDGETPDILDNAYVVVDFEGGVRAMLDLCMFAEQSKNQSEITATGDEGKVEAAIPASTLTIGRRDRSQLRRDPARITTSDIHVDAGILAAGGHHGSTFGELSAFARAARNGLPAEVSPLDGLMAVAMGLAAHRSIKEGRPVSLRELI